MKIFAISAFALTSLLAATALPSAATAQTAGPVNQGPAIPGICVYFNQRLLAQSTVGASVQARMEQLATEVQGELAPYGSSISSEYQRIQAGGATVTDADRQALQTRVQEAQLLEQTRENELRYTLSEQRRLISAAVEPLLVTVYQERGCGILIDRESVFILNPAMDVTDAVIERLNATLPSLSFNRLPVPVQQPAQ